MQSVASSAHSTCITCLLAPAVLAHDHDHDLGIRIITMAPENGYVTGSLFGPGWKHVQEWPHAGPSRLQGEPEQTEQPVDDDEYEDVEEEVRIVFRPETLG